MKKITMKIASVLCAAALSASAASALSVEASAEWIKNGSGYSYVNDTTGRMAFGWTTIGKKKYYFDENGVMKTGWQVIGGNTYYFGRNGVLNGSKTSSYSKASDVLNSIKDSLGTSYTCDNVCTSTDIENLGIDMRYVNSFAYEDNSISAINYDIALILNVKPSYKAKAVKILQQYYQQIIGTSQLYNADIYRVEQARIFSQGNYVALLILGDNSYYSGSEDDMSDYAFGEALKVDKAWKNIFGSVPENLAEISEDDDIGSALGSSSAK